jgi:aryl-alcohol dehydrogenase-like predicted oxidoreductase
MPANHDTRHDTRPLGRTGIHVLPLGIGTNKWRRADRGAVLETYRTIHDAGPCMIDTAEIYFSERVVGDCLRAGPSRAVIASKFLPFPGRTSPRRLMSALDGSLARLGLKTIDLYYVHYPLPLIDVGVFAEGLVEAVKSGKARAVGVANFNADQMRRIADHLARAGVPLAANQVNYSLLRRAAETNGVLEACRELDVALVAYFPLRPAASRSRRTAWTRKRC